jgi:RNA polymerase sigma-70 factor (ECF subfamily)
VARRRIDPFEVFLNDNIASVTLFCRATCGNPSIIDDVIQETFIRAWRYYPTLRAEHSSKSWLIRICRNVMTDLATKWAPTIHHVSEELEDGMDQFGQSDLLDLMTALSNEHREVLVLCGLLGYDYETAAEILELPLGTVRSRLARARENMAQLLQESEQQIASGS